MDNSSHILLGIKINLFKSAKESYTLSSQRRGEGTLQGEQQVNDENLQAEVEVAVEVHYVCKASTYPKGRLDYLARVYEISLYSTSDDLRNKAYRFERRLVARTV